MTKNSHIVLILVGSAILIAVLAWLGTRSSSEVELIPQEVGEESAFMAPLTTEEQEIVNPSNTNVMNPTAVFTTNQGVIELELFEDQMPITVGNFVVLAESGFYDNTKFHRVIEGFMIQGGDPNSRGENEAIYGTGGPEENVSDEFVAGELLTNTRGTIAMANTGQPNSGGSQWFINLVDNTNLDFDKPPAMSKHPVFGRVTGGMDVVDAIGAVATKSRDIPVDPVVIESITIVRTES